jgi:DNA-binding XRE family transcriptional regulator
LSSLILGGDRAVGASKGKQPLPPGRAASDPLRAALAKNVARLRAQAGLSQRVMAARAGIAHRRISELEAGKANPTIDTILAVARVLGVDPRDLTRD